jgi:plastocyanin
MSAPGWRGRAATAAAVLAGGVALGATFLDGGARDASPAAGGASDRFAPVNLTSSCPTKAVADPAVIDIALFAYCPAHLSVAVGVEVVWANSDLAPHTVTYDGPDGPVDSGSMGQGQRWATRFTAPGTYQYYCRFHPGMAGTIVVDAGP